MGRDAQRALLTGVICTLGIALRDDCLLLSNLEYIQRRPIFCLSHKNEVCYWVSLASDSLVI